MNSKELLPLVINCFVMIFICKMSPAQNIKTNPQDNYRAIHWTIDNGLSHPDNYCMIKDIKGFLWIGSGNGLNRFDGNTFKYYFSEKTQKTSIADNEILALSEDSMHNIWIGTGEGLCRYDISADTFTNFSSATDPKRSAQTNPFWAEKNEMLCFDYNEVCDCILQYPLICRESNCPVFGGRQFRRLVF